MFENETRTDHHKTQEWTKEITQNIKNKNLVNLLLQKNLANLLLLQ